MKKYFRHLAVIASYLYIAVVYAVPADFGSVDIPQLAQQVQHAKVTKRVSDLFSRSHYKYLPLNDALSQQVFERYIEQLDYNKQIFSIIWQINLVQ